MNDRRTVDRLCGKRVVIIGLARQGTALARFLAGVGAVVIVSDLRSVEELAPALAELADVKVEFVLGGHPESMLEGADVLAISGGVPADSPLVLAARRRGLMITNDSQEFLRRTRATTIGVTGSAGKTTTTALTGEIASWAGRNAWVGGNIGYPLISHLEQIQDGDLVVQELSSFQLEIWTESPPVAAILNITPNHLDRHKTMAVYREAKVNILRHQDSNGVAVLNADDPESFALRLQAPGRVRLFSMERKVEDGAFIAEGQIWLQGDGAPAEAVCDLGKIRLRGRHNLANVLAAVTLADSVHIPAAAMGGAIAGFSGVEHRLELAATIDGVLFVNDSIATAPERALAAIRSFQEPLILLAGGRDKELDWEEWGAVVTTQAKAVVLFGELAGQLAALLTAVRRERKIIAAGSVFCVNTLEEAVPLAAGLASPGDVVLLAPGGTSFDAYQDFAARGEAFRALVAALSPRNANGFCNPVAGRDACGPVR